MSGSGYLSQERGQQGAEPEPSFKGAEFRHGRLGTKKRLQLGNDLKQRTGIGTESLQQTPAPLLGH